MHVLLCKKVCKKVCNKWMFGLILILSALNIFSKYMDQLREFIEMRGKETQFFLKFLRRLHPEL